MSASNFKDLYDFLQKICKSCLKNIVHNLFCMEKLVIFKFKYLEMSIFAHALTNMEGKLEYNLSISIGLVEVLRGHFNLGMIKVSEIYEKFDDIFWTEYTDLLKFVCPNINNLT